MNFNSEIKSTSSFDFNTLIRTYTKKWKWFAISLIVALSIAYLLSRYTLPEYSAQAKIQILEGQDSNSELSLFQDLDVFSGNNTSRIEDEIQSLKSRSNFIEVVEELQLNRRVYVIGDLLESEVYSNLPINISFIVSDSIINKSSFNFYINISSETSFLYSNDEGGVYKKFSFGSNVKTPVGGVVITPNMEVLNKYIGKKLKVSYRPVTSIAQLYQNKISILASEKGSNMINLFLNDYKQNKARDIINSLIRIYNKNGVIDKKAVADRTSKFINDRISEIYADLSTVDQNAQDFKSGKGITDIASEANINLTVGSANQQELQNTTTQLNIAQSMKGIVENLDGYELLPSNIGLSDASIANTTAKYNELVLQRNRLLKSSNEKNPIIVNLDQQLSGLKRNMQSSLGSMTNNLGLQVNNLSNQMSKINSKIYSAPKNERALRDITRQQQTTESLYLYLLQKREESQIAFASATPKSKIIDAAYSITNSPVSPNKTTIFLGAIFLGLFIPFGFIYVSDLIDNKIHNKTGLEKVLKDVPVLAELPKVSKKDSKMVLKDDRSVLAESLRILRINLDYLMKSKKGPGKKNVIYVTSSVSGEGKTFLSSNLSMILSNTNKKVLLIGADIRNPKLYSFFDNDNKNIDKLKSKNQTGDLGLTEYLYNDELTSADITNSLLVHTNTIDVIYSGKIPPNPAELLMSDRLKDLLEESSSKYDYVIVDTAPLMVVSDTLIISEYSDHIIYVTRAGMTELDVVNFPLKLQEEGKLHNLSFVVNDVKENNLGYGGKYGYGYGKTLKKWWKF